MGESFTRRRQASKLPKERLFSGRPNGAPAKNFGTIVRALWPHKPALNLAQRLGCSERAAQFYIDGERKITARAVAVILAEMLD
jgi:hypothetical protein